MHFMVISDAHESLLFARSVGREALIGQLAVALFMQRPEVLSVTGPRATASALLARPSAINPTEDNLCLASPEWQEPAKRKKFPEVVDAGLHDDEPSCSAAEALERQEPFVNPTLANHAPALRARAVSLRPNFLSGADL